MKAGSLAELEAFVTVARCGGFRPAADELSLSPSAISHAIAALEERLAVRLFNRTTRSVALTEAGEEYLAGIRPALDAIRDAGERIGEQSATPTGTLRLNASLYAAQLVMAPVILDYLRRYPGMSVEIVTEGALVDVIGEGFDAGIRNVEAIPQDMIAIPVTKTMRLIVVGAPVYLATCPAPLVPDDLGAHRCIRARMASGRIYRWEFEKHGTSLEVDVPGRLTLDEASLIRHAAIAGEGLALLPDRTVRDDLAAGSLCQVLDDWTPTFPGFSLYYPSRRHVPAKLRALIALLREQNA